MGNNITNKLIDIIFNNIKSNDWIIFDKEGIPAEVEKEKKTNLLGQKIIELKLGNEIYEISCKEVE